MKINRAIILILALALAACQLRGDLMADMIRLERTELTAMILSGGGNDPALGRVAIAAVNKDWAEFKARHESEYPGDLEWGGTISLMEMMITDAGRWATEGSMSTAHSALADAHRVLSDMRTERKIPFVTDDLMAFGFFVERVGIAGLDHQIDGDDIDYLKADIPELIKAWNKFEAATFDPKLFGFDETRMALYREAVKSEREHVMKLGHAVAFRDEPAMLREMDTVQDGYDRLLRIFSDLDVQPAQ